MARSKNPRGGKIGIPGRMLGYLLRHLQNLLGALGGLWRQPLASLMTVSVIGIALSMPAGLHLMVENGRALSGGWESTLEWSVYLRPGVSESRAQTLANELQRRPGIEKVTVITADQALEEFRIGSGFGEALELLTDNPLPNVLVVQPSADAESAGQTTQLADELKKLGDVDLVQLDTAWVNRFHAILDTVRRAVALASAVLALGVLLIVGNTIRLDILNRRQEIEVAKLVGASDAFIRRPFLYHGLWYGIGGGILAIALVQLIGFLLKEPVSRVAGLYGSDYRLLSLALDEAGLLLLAGAALGWLGSWIAASRHLRDMDPEF
ncbi:MAG: permease-like cell division protein FtsX [Gammaproteobacteria bacterium]|nr:permease-like cell division protein FtsX [Gammaproteobacteria bacterium]